MGRRHLPFAWLGLSLLLAPAAPAAEAPPAVTLEAVRLEPAAPGPDTLCRLFATLRNRGERPVSSFAFRVLVNGRELPVYRRQLFLKAVPPGETVELRLYNLWTTESSRPAAADGRLQLAVALVEAQWMEIRDESGVETWKPLGAVAGLPSERRLEVALAKQP
jgi:hypothetical protein